MSTEDLLRYLAEQKDVNAMLALRKHALRYGDTLLQDYTKEVAQRQIESLEKELLFWKDIAGIPIEGVGPALILLSYGRYKIQAIKAVRSITGFGLRESKELVDNSPAVIVRNISLSTTVERVLKEFGREKFTDIEVVWDNPERIEKERGLRIRHGFAVPSISERSSAG